MDSVEVVKRLARPARPGSSRRRNEAIGGRSGRARLTRAAPRTRRRTAAVPPEPPRASLQRRAAGILMHLTSLPGRHGSGDLGSHAFAFADWLKDARQSWWQMLPVGPIGPGHSPYSSTSAFAGGPLLVSLDGLIEAGLLTELDALPTEVDAGDRVAFPRVRRHRERCLRRAFETFISNGSGLYGEFVAFREHNASWLDDYALFEALREANRGRLWTQWPRDVRARRSAALRAARDELRDEYEYACFVQFMFDRQWRALHDHAASRGVSLIGDIPIFVSHDSADVWAHPELFALRADGRPRAITGVPPDLFSDTGQLWHHPQYVWARHEQSGFAWWIERFRRMFALFDAVRIDHFLGFNRVWWIAGGSTTAQRGRWVRSPGRALFGAVRAALGRLEIIAEDLGLLTPEAAALRDELGFPGMRLLQAGLPGVKSYHLPHGFVANCAAYPGTHDNDTLQGWFSGLARSAAKPARTRGAKARRRAGRASAAAGGNGSQGSEQARVLDFLQCDAEHLHWGAIRALYASAANTVVVPLQDVLGLGSRARMNTPATATGNWRWRFADWPPPARATEQLARLALLYGRAGG